MAALLPRARPGSKAAVRSDSDEVQEGEKSCNFWVCGMRPAPPEEPASPGGGGGGGDEAVGGSTPRAARAEVAVVRSVIVSSADPPRARPPRGLWSRPPSFALSASIRGCRDVPQPVYRTAVQFREIAAALNVENPGCVVPPVTDALERGSVRAATLFFERILAHGALKTSP